MTDNASVIKSWVRGYSSNNGRSSLHTNGRELFSYQLRIGYTDDKGNKVVEQYNASTGNVKSMTTSRHVSMASVQADREVTPNES